MTLIPAHFHELACFGRRNQCVILAAACIDNGLSHQAACLCRALWSRTCETMLLPIARPSWTGTAFPIRRPIDFVENDGVKGSAYVFALYRNRPHSE